MATEEAGVAGRGNRKFTLVQIEEMRRMHEAGVSNMGIAKVMGTTHSTVQRLRTHGYGWVHPAEIRYRERKKANQVRPVSPETPWAEVAEAWSRWHPSEALTGRQAESLFHNVIRKIRNAFEKAGIVEPEDLELFGSGGGTADAVDSKSTPEQG